MLRHALLSGVVLAACGGARANVAGSASPNPAEPATMTHGGPSTTSAKPEAKPDPFRATSGPGDAPVSFVRDERNSRLDRPAPSGRGRELWRVRLSGARRDPCRGRCAASDVPYVLTAGNRVAVVGGDHYELFDRAGHRVDGGKMPAFGVRIDRASGNVVADGTRTADTPLDAKVAAHDGLVVMVKDGAVFVGERALEGRFEALEVAIDPKGLACVVLRQKSDLMLWSIPLSNSASIGRQKIPGVWREPIAPPLLGESLRVIAFDSGLVAIGLDGKKRWARKGVPTGGATLGVDDRLLVADGGTILVVDPSGKSKELWSDKDATFVTAPILDAEDTLYVVSGELLHAIGFDGSGNP